MHAGRLGCVSSNLHLRGTSTSTHLRGTSTSTDEQDRCRQSDRAAGVLVGRAAGDAVGLLYALSVRARRRVARPRSGLDGARCMVKKAQPSGAMAERGALYDVEQPPRVDPRELSDRTSPAMTADTRGPHSLGLRGLATLRQELRYGAVHH